MADGQSPYRDSGVLTSTRVEHKRAIVGKQGESVEPQIGRGLATGECRVEVSLAREEGPQEAPISVNQAMQVLGEAARITDELLRKLGYQETSFVPGIIVEVVTAAKTFLGIYVGATDKAFVLQVFVRNELASCFIPHGQVIAVTICRKRFGLSGLVVEKSYGPGDFYFSWLHHLSQSELIEVAYSASDYNVRIQAWGKIQSDEVKVTVIVDNKSDEFKRWIINQITDRKMLADLRARFCSGEWAERVQRQLRDLAAK